MQSAIIQWNNLGPELELIYHDIYQHCTKTRYMRLYTQIYNFYTKSFNKIKSNKIDNPTYRHFYQLMLEFLDDLNSKLLLNIPSNSVLPYVVHMWDKYHQASSIVNNIFDYFNRTFISKLENYGKGDYYFIGSFYISWRNKFLNVVLDKVIVELIDLINQYRETKTANIGLIASIKECLITIDTDYSYKYYANFMEKPILENLNSVYYIKSNDFLDDNNVISYINKLDDWFNLEMYLANKCYATSIEKIHVECYNVLIKDKLLILCNQIELLFQHPETFNILYKYIKNYDNDLQVLSNAFSDYILQNNKSIVDGTYEEFCTNLINIYLQYSDIIRNYLDNSNLLRADFDKVISQLTNRNTKSAEFLAKYLNYILKNSQEEHVDNASKMIEYLDNRDIFIKFHQRLLAKRLLSNNYCIINENNVIDNIKKVCGFDEISRMKRMLQDIVSTQDLNNKFRQEYNINDFNIQVITHGIWPINSSNEEFIIPEELNHNIDKFSKYYNNIYSGRKLTWQHKISSGEITTNYLKKKYIFGVSTYQLAILCLFDNYYTINKSIIQDNTNISSSLIDSILMILLKFHIIIKDDDGYRLNMNYKNKNIRKNLNIMVKTEKNKEAGNVYEQTESDRKLIIQSNIVRIMKHRKILEHNNLISECLQQVSKIFKPNVSTVKKCIEILIEKEYLERDSSNSSIYKYLA